VPAWNSPQEPGDGKPHPGRCFRRLPEASCNGGVSGIEHPSIDQRCDGHATPVVQGGSLHRARSAPRGG